MAPMAAVPLPGGRPAPSGGMLMSQAAISAGVAGWPRFGPSTLRAAAGWPRSGPSTLRAAAQPASAAAASAATTLRVYILHLPVGRHAPRLDRVVVEDDVAAVHGDELVALGLRRPRAVRRAALQHGGCAVPFPRGAKPRQRTRLRRR